MDKEELPFCGCGCGGKVSKPGNKFIHGHNRRGAHPSKEVGQKIRKALQGHTVTEETKVKISKTLMNHPVSEETRKKIGAASKGRPSPKKNKTYEEIYGDQAEEEKRKREESHLGIPSGMLNKHHTKEAKQKLCDFFGGDTYIGENNPNWKGGISKSPYPFDFDEELKELIRKRDYNTCQLCGKSEEENGRKLDIHHIDYVKENLNPSNLISLCRSCNVKVNGTRKYWINFFQLKLKIRKIG